jgi:hypothetical protein
MMNEANALTECTQNMHALGLALSRYELDHRHLPRAETWADDIYPYVRDWAVFRCPKDKSKGRSSYAMNDNLSGRDTSKMGDASNIVLLYEPAQAGRNPHGTGRDLPVRGRHSYPRIQTKVTRYCFLNARGELSIRERPFRPPLRWGSQRSTDRNYRNARAKGTT